MNLIFPTSKTVQLFRVLLFMCTYVQSYESKNPKQLDQWKKAAEEFTAEAENSGIIWNSKWIKAQRPIQKSQHDFLIYTPMAYLFSIAITSSRSQVTDLARFVKIFLTSLGFCFHLITTAIFLIISQSCQTLFAYLYMMELYFHIDDWSK